MYVLKRLEKLTKQNWPKNFQIFMVNFVIKFLMNWGLCRLRLRLFVNQNSAGPGGVFDYFFLHKVQMILSKKKNPNKENFVEIKLF